MSDTPVLKIVGLSKSYGSDEPVLANFDLEIMPGKIVGLLGPNGCGKSTLLKLVAGLLVPDAGEIYIDGIPRSEDTNSLISYLPERTYFTSGMKVDELIDYFLDFYDDFDADRAREMLGYLGINTARKLSELSKGMKEKVQLVMVMSRQTKLYMLDEPIGGVDPASREYVLNTILTSYNPDASVIITTHLISDIESILDEFAFMSYGGEIVRMGNADKVREATGMTLDELFREVFRCYARY